MKKQCITLFGLGVAVGIAITMLCIVIMREPADQTNLAEETTYTQDTKIPEVISNIGVEETSNIETDENCSNYEVVDTDNSMSGSTLSQESKSIQLKDENGKFTSEALELAKKYLISYNNNQWDGYTTIDSESGIHIGTNWGIIQLEGEDTPIRSEKRIICDNAVKAYMSGEWDGMEMLIDGKHTIKLSEGGGYILLDGHIAVGQKNLDIPEYAYDLLDDNIRSYEYVPGQGTYTIIDKKLVKFLRGERITLSGEGLSWKGFQDFEDLISKIPDYYIMYDLPMLIYNKLDGKLYLISGDETCTLDNSENYVYVFDDINISKMKYLGKVDFEHEYPGNVDIETLINQNK